MKMNLRKMLIGAAAGLAVAAATLAATPQERVEAALDKANASIQRIVDIPDSQRTFRNTIEAIDDVIAQVELDTNMIQFLAYVSTDADVRAAGQAAEQAFSNWFIDLGKNEDLYKAIKAYAETNPELDRIEQRLVDRLLRDYRRSGMALSEAERDELKAIQQKLTTLSIEFQTNINEDDSRVPLSREELMGMDDDYLDSLDKVGDVYLVGLSYPEFLPLMDRCDNEETRKKMWIAYKRRGGQKNVRVLEEVLELRAQAADILGYDHAADYEIEVRMAKDADTVMSFYENLRPKVREKALRDLAEFTAAKRDHTVNPDAKLEPWDFSYYEKKLLRDKYAVDSETVREYFPMDAVMDGLFSITQKIYGLTYRNITDRASSYGQELWHEDVELYEVLDDSTGEVIGAFYLDLHPRDNKYGHAAQWGLSQHKVYADGKVNKPVAALVCNFTKPTADKPSLMSHDEVETFFHEFGHCLHTILSDSRFYYFSGTNVERDFVEAPSQMFENWVWNADVLATFARHYETGEPLPRDLLEGMAAARNLGSGMLAERQFYYGLYDMTCHLDPEGDVDTTQLALDLWSPAGENVELYDPVPHTYFQAAFGHLMGYQAGYYGYQWSLVYACDMFSEFEKRGMMDPEAGMEYREKVISKGGTKDGLDLVRDYLGREPDMDAYLKHLGLE